MEGGQEVTYAYTSDNNTVTVIGDPSVSGHEIQLEPNSSSQTQQIFQVSNTNAASTDRSQKASTPFAPVRKTRSYSFSFCVHNDNICIFYVTKQIY